MTGLVINLLVLIKPQIKYNELSRVISIGNKVIIFYDRISSIVFYDVGKNEWSEEHFEITGSLDSYSCVKLPCI